MELGAYSTQSGNGLRTERPGRGSGRNRRPWRASTRRTLAGETHPPFQIGAAVSELAVGTVELAPLIEQPQDLGDLPVQQAVHRAATRRPVLELAGGTPAQPPVDAQLIDLKHLAGCPDRPALSRGLLQQLQQPGLGGRIHPGRDPATQPQRPFPSTSSSRTASSLSASPSRAASALAASNSTSRLAAATPGLESASAASAPSLATVRSRMIVERSTPYRSAASAIVVSPRTSCSQISYFCNGVRNRLARRPSRSAPRSCSVMIRPSFSGQQPERMLSDPNPVLYRKLRCRPAGGQAGLLVPPAHLATVAVELLDPGRPQDLHRLHAGQLRWRVRGMDHFQQPVAVPTNR